VAGDPKRASAVENRLFESRLSRNSGIRMQRIVIAGKPEQERLVGSRSQVANQVRIPIRQAVTFSDWGCSAAESAIVSRDDAGSYRTNHGVIPGQSQLGFELQIRTTFGAPIGQGNDSLIRQ